MRSGNIYFMHNKMSFSLVIGIAMTLASPAVRGDSWKRITLSGSRSSMSATAAGVRLVTNKPWASDQHWSLRRVDAVHVALVSEKNSLALSVTAGGNVTLAPFINTPAQQWTLVPGKDGRTLIYHAGRRLIAGGAQALTLANDDGIAPSDRDGDWALSVERAEVFIGGTHPLKWMADPANADGWQFVRTNADGLYTSNVGIKTHILPASYEQWATLDYSPWENLMRGIGAQMKTRRLFYETDAALTKHPEWDRHIIESAMSVGWTVSDAVLWDTEHIGYLDTYKPHLLAGDAQRMLHIGTGTWVLGGNFADRSFKNNAMIQDAMLRWGAACATEGNGSSYFPEDPNGASNTDTLIQWNQAHLPMSKTQSNFSSGDLGPLGFLRQVQRCVKRCEDAGTKPDQWAITYYGPKPDIAFGPETDPRAYFYAAKWLIQHEADPVKYPAIDAPYFADRFKNLDQWDVDKGAGATVEAGHDCLMTGNASIRTKAMPWLTDHQIHLSWLWPELGEAGVQFYTDQNGGTYCWWFSDGQLRCTRTLNHKSLDLKPAIKLPQAANGLLQHVVVEIVGRTFYTYVNRKLVDTTTADAAPIAAPITLTSSGGRVKFGPITAY